jgi:CRP-like cAMP-binding protein
VPTLGSNLLLATLRPAYQKSLLARLKTVSLPVKEVIYETDETPKYAHFLTSGLASVVSTMADGSTAEVGIWGKEGLAESFQLLGNASNPNRCYMQMGGTALRMPFNELQAEFLESEELRSCVLQGVQTQSFILGQLAACNRLHEAEQRLARWLLMVSDRMESPAFFITQEFLATMLGSRRTTVTLAASQLQRKGLIKYSRGRIQILNSSGLEGAACECYRVVRDLYLNYYGPKQATAV